MAWSSMYGEMFGERSGASLKRSESALRVGANNGGLERNESRLLVGVGNTPPGSTVAALTLDGGM